ncbi:transcription factor bHLH162-like [Diospyros lotus]|uniref:transcription factor bHLH162-like n=1 Tax=Diospyros lotus TaxID=55363 RepID=UPI0022582304|nr:transcription factor bHLH162-like [Diospyros lotus]
MGDLPKALLIPAFLGFLSAPSDQLQFYCFSLSLSLSLSRCIYLPIYSVTKWGLMMKKGNGSPEHKLDRKVVERNRRIHMKGLYFRLSSLLPPHHFKPTKDMSQLDLLDQAATYIKQLKERTDELEARREAAAAASGQQLRINKKKKKKKNVVSDADDGDGSMMYGFRAPVVEFRELGSIIEVVLISGLKNKFMLCEVIRVLQDEGAEVVSASCCTKEDRIFHTLHAQVKVSRVGVETSRVCQRLQELAC